MLSPVLGLVGDFDAGKLEPNKLAKFLGMTPEELATLSDIHRDTSTKAPYDQQTQAAMGTVVRILVAADSLMAGPGSGDRAALWFKNQPLSGHGGKTAADLVREGHAGAVMEHLHMLEEGIYA